MKAAPVAVTSGTPKRRMPALTAKLPERALTRALPWKRARLTRSVVAGRAPEVGEERHDGENAQHEQNWVHDRSARDRDDQQDDPHNQPEHLNLLVRVFAGYPGS